MRRSRYSAARAACSTPGGYGPPRDGCHAALDRELRDEANTLNPAHRGLDGAAIYAVLLEEGGVPAHKEFKVAVTKDNLVFASAHFITFSGHRCEKLHGHNYRTRVVVEGGLDPRRTTCSTSRC